MTRSIGILLAYALQINTFLLLGPVLPQATLQALQTPFVLLGAQTSALIIGGTFLSGFGASLGSSFWHDQLDRLRQLKEPVKAVEEAK